MKSLAVALLLVASTPLLAQPAQAAEFTPTANPVFQVDYPSPTADKPQSKLWYMDGCWWALLPRTSGPSLWQRTDDGWKEQVEIAGTLRGQPGRADVWPGARSVTAAAVAELDKSNPSIGVFRLLRGESIADTPWKPSTLGTLLPPVPEDRIETATIAQDGVGTFWVAAVAGVKVCVWQSTGGMHWSAPTVLAEGLALDDICVVTPLPDGDVGVIWSDQVREGFFMRVHAAGAPAEVWREEEVIQLGDKAADDHLNTCLTADGTLWLASKNEIDAAGKPQFALHARNRDGAWRNWPYGVRTESTRPSRPIVVANTDGSVVLTGYGDNDRALPAPYGAKIVFARVNPDLPEMVEAPRTVIAPDPVYNSVIQNVTGPRNPFPADAPWIVLASDQEGRVYEADLSAAFSSASGGKER